MLESSESPLVARLRAALPLMLGLVVVLIVYARTLQAPFLWDDRALLDAPTIRDLDYPWNYLTTPFWNRADARESLFYRPIVSFSLALDHAIHGGNASGFHLTNVVLHLLAVGLVYALARRHGAARAPAALLATLWGLLPRLSESVAWISGRTDELCAVFVLAAWLVYRSANARRVLVASGLAFLALLAKEGGIAAVLAITVAELYPKPSRAALLRLAPLALLTGAYFTLRAAALSGAEPVAIPLTAAERALAVLEALGRYAYMVVDAWHPEAQMGVLKSPNLGFVGLGGIAGLGALALAVRTARRPPSNEAALALTLGLVPLLLVIHLVPMPWLAVAGDRMLYLPLAVLAVMVSPRLEALSNPRTPVFAGLVVLGLSFAWTTRKQTAVYADSAEFWVRAVETTPIENWGPSLELAAEYLRAGLFRDAWEIARSVEARPDPTGVQRGSSRTPVAILSSLGAYDEARAHLERQGANASIRVHLSRARLFANVGRVDDAIRLARELATQFPKLTEARELADQLERTKPDLARLASGEVSGLERDVLRARVEVRLGRRPEAVKAWLSVLQNPAASADVVEEAMAFLIPFASLDDMLLAGRLYRERGGASPVLALTFAEREQAANALRERRERVERALGLELGK